jgi:hypothetical protein
MMLMMFKRIELFLNILEIFRLPLHKNTIRRKHESNVHEKSHTISNRTLSANSGFSPIISLSPHCDSNTGPIQKIV